MGLIGAGLLGEPVFQGAALGAVLPLQARHMLLPLLRVLGLRLRVLGLRGAEVALRPAQLCPGAEQEAYADGAGGGGRDTGDARGYSLRAHERGGNGSHRLRPVASATSRTRRQGAAPPTAE
ncbi:hypothetical protein ABIE67_008659 [Streptomyces sp. V4I8]|uniref:hypothetical protein n=1 Tax=Streptomyces sp. V4I8 TaxID=3156469 RepID=UPI0035189393